MEPGRKSMRSAVVYIVEDAEFFEMMTGLVSHSSL